MHHSLVYYRPASSHGFSVSLTISGILSRSHKIVNISHGYLNIIFYVELEVLETFQLSFNKVSFPYKMTTPVHVIFELKWLVRTAA